MANKEELGKVLDNLINDKSDQAQVHFHDYLQDKLQTTLHGDIDITDNTDQMDGDE